MLLFQDGQSMEEIAHQSTTGGLSQSPKEPIGQEPIERINLALVDLNIGLAVEPPSALRQATGRRCYRWSG